MFERIGARGRTLLIRGEAGIGKSVLLREAKRRAEKLGMPVLAPPGRRSRRRCRLPLATSALADRSGPPAWETIPSWAVIGTADRVITPASQRSMAARAHARTTEITAPHLSMIANPLAVAGVIVKAANATG